MLSYGDILKIDKQGKIKQGSFETLKCNYGWQYRGYSNWREQWLYQNIKNNSYVEDLKSVANYYGYSGSDIDDLLEDGFSCEEIEDILCMSHF